MHGPFGHEQGGITAELHMAIATAQLQVEQLQSRAHLARHRALVHLEHVADGAFMPQPQVEIQNREMLQRKDQRPASCRANNSATAALELRRCSD